MRYRANDNATLRLFCFPFAGGGVAAFRTWADELPEFVDVCSVELPGRDRLILEPPIESLALLLERLVGAVSHWIDLPYVMFGHSMGALLAFELVRRLTSAGKRPPTVLFVSAHRAPHLPDTREMIHDLPRAKFIAALRELEGTPPDVLNNKELIDIYLPALKADFTLAETYTYTPGHPLDCPILAFGGRDDFQVTEAEIAAWREQTTGDFQLRMLKGNHFFLQSSAKLLLYEIARELEKLRDRLNR
jgi:surfactin synthase thioesterase subunit